MSLCYKPLCAGCAALLVCGSLGTPAVAAPPLQSSIQAPVTTLKGRVLDPSGMPVAGAHITVDPAPSLSASPAAVSDAGGEFTLAISPTTRAIRITAPGFDELSVPTTTAWIGDRSDFTLRIAALRESVSVSGASGYAVGAIGSATRSPTPLRDVPQAITVVTRELMSDQLMTSIADVTRYTPGITAHQGENNRDDLVIRGNRSSADFFLNGVRDDTQYYRDLYNLERVEALKGPNAMIFGRGGGGGLLNRVTKEASLEPLRDVSLQAGAYGSARFTGDINHPVGKTVALRMNGMFQHSGSFRDGVDLERGAINPTITFLPSSRTKVTAAYEYLRDVRVADRGITSFQGRPAAVNPSTFYGNAEDSHVRAQVNLASAFVEHRWSGVTLRNRAMVGRYNRFYQNYVPGAATADRAQVALTAYNNASDRTNLFNQTDVLIAASTRSVRHTLLAGVEVGQQTTDNFRQSGFFNNSAASILVPFERPTTTLPVTFRQNATDADNHVRAKVTEGYLQDQAEVSRHLQLVGGVRVDRFDLQYRNNRDGARLTRVDTLVSPRMGVVIKPTVPLSVYGSYSVSHLPSSGDQFSSLTIVTQQLEPERFKNLELGAKWDVLRSLSLTAAVYRLDRTNTRSTDPNDPTRVVQTGSQRTNGFEFAANGQLTPLWRLAGGYAYQDASVTRATVNARVGATPGQVPRHTLSLWNNYQFHKRLAAAIGIVHRTDMFAAVDNTVTLPGYTEADAALFVTLRRGVRLQANVENLFDVRYFINADSNTNISPGSPRALRVSLSAAF